MERSPAEVNIGRHSPDAAELVLQLSSDTTRFTSTTESYRARKRQLEKKPGSIWSVTSRSSLAILISSFCVYTSAGDLLQAVLHYAQGCVGGLSCSPHSFRSAPWTAPGFVQKIKLNVSGRPGQTAWLLGSVALQVLSCARTDAWPLDSATLLKRTNIVTLLQASHLSLEQHSDVRCGAYSLSPPSTSLSSLGSVLSD